MHTLASSMPRLFGRSQTPTPSQSQPQEPPAPRAKLVRRTGDHFTPLGHPGHPGHTGYSGYQSPASFEPLHREGSIISASLASASASGYEVLLNGPDRSSLCGSIGSGQNQHHPTQNQQHQQHRYYAVRSQRNLHRSWLAAADARRLSGPGGERPPPRKLVKDPGGSARPSAAHEIPDEDGDLRRKAVVGGAGQNNSQSTAGLDRGSFGGPGSLGIRRKISRWRDLKW
ncbi:hypothetical protein Sste5346_010290 [Sporothrix stenoceras]|uniref:Uncharacterized protein n=1 Tax=Sporothrix stenoceras TaxID=5173 RepID=A0ABR3YHL7_9PEZI